MSPVRRTLLLWIAVGAAGFLVVPWYILQDSVLGTGWIKDFSGKDSAPAILQAFKYARWWLLPLGVLIAAASLLLPARVERRMRATGLIAIGATGFVYLFAQGFAIGPRGFDFEWLNALGTLPTGQYGMGLGATMVAAAFAMLFSLGFLSLFVIGGITGVMLGAILGTIGFMRVTVTAQFERGLLDNGFQLQAIAERRGGMEHRDSTDRRR